MGEAARNLRHEGDFPCEAEIARRLSQGEDRWRRLVKQFEAQDPTFPRKDPLMGGRYWPAVQAYFARRARLVTVERSADEEMAKENLSAL